jgi:AbrB family looped-hinge helix DNA binding protein
MIASGGRLLVPAAFRHELGLADGDTVLIELEGGELHVRPMRSALRSIQRRLRRYAADGRSVADELVADRRAEAGRN